MMQRTELDTSASSASGDRDGRTGEFRYRAFISYSHEDQPWADWLIKALETYRVPSRLVDSVTAAGTVPKRLTPIFRDRDEMASASDLGDSIRAALAESASLIVICSPASANSHWVNQEIQAFQALGRGHRIFCLIVAGEPNASALPGQEYKECLAPSLRETRNDDDVPVAHFIEPAAADVRPGMDSRATARLKLVAGLLGLGLDDLRQRDQQRHLRRLIAVTALALLVTATTTTLAIAALMARQSAQAAQQAAERRQKQAEGLVDFMLGDLNDKLREVNRLDILESVDDKAMAYFASLPVTDVTDQSLVLRAKALRKIGSVRLDQGDYKRALTALNLAVGIDKKRLQASPTNPSLLTEYGTSLNRLGNVYMNMGNAETHDAEVAYRQSNRALTRALELRPDNPAIQLQLVYAHNNLARVLMIQNNIDQATVLRKQQISLLEHLLANDPGNPVYARNMAITSANVGSVEYERGQLIDSIKHLMKANQILATQMQNNPEDRNSQTFMIISLAKLANSLHAVGRQAQALRYIGLAVQMADSLSDFDPSQVNWRLMRRAYGTWQARWQREVDPASSVARRHLEQQRRDLKQLFGLSPKSDVIRRSLVSAQLALAEAYGDGGHAADAVRMLRGALDTLPDLSSPSMGLSKELRQACRAELLLAQLEPSRRKRHGENALHFIQHTASDSSNPDDLSLWALALLDADKVRQAKPILDRLIRMGYQPQDFTHALASRDISYAVPPTFNARLDSVIAQLDGSALSRTVLSRH